MINYPDVRTFVVRHGNAHEEQLMQLFGLIEDKSCLLKATVERSLDYGSLIVTFVVKPGAGAQLWNTVAGREVEKRLFSLYQAQLVD